MRRACAPLFFTALMTPGPVAMAEPFALGACDGVTGIGVLGYSKSANMTVSTVNELTEICWNEGAAQLTSREVSRDLELTQKQGSTLHYQRLDGGTVSPLNEQLQVGIWEARPGGSIPYLRWTTEGSRTPAELNGFDFAVVEGFLAGEAGQTPRPEAAVYDVEMVLTGVGAPMMSMAYGMFLPMQGTVEVDGDAFSITLTSFMPGMGPGEMQLDIGLTETDVGFDGNGTITMENGLLAGAAPTMWKRLELRVDEIAPLYSGSEMAFVASMVGEMETFDGATAPVAFAFIGSGGQR